MKKQIAVLMAAATAVTTVAPALASADVNEYGASVSEANAKIKAALNERYKNKTENGINASNADEVDAYMNSRYAVAIVTDSSNVNTNTYDLELLASSPYKSDISGKAGLVGSALIEGAKKIISGATDANVYVVKDATRVEGLLESLVIGKNKANVGVVVVDKGIKDGSSVQTMTEKHYVTASQDFDADTMEKLYSAYQTLLENVKKGNDKGYVDELKAYDAAGEDITSSVSEANLAKNLAKIELTLTSGKEYTIEANDKAFDFSKAIDANGNEIKLDGSNAQSVLDQIEGFKYIENKDNKSVTITLPMGDTDVYKLNDVQSSTIEMGKIFTSKNGYTKEGADLVNGIVKSRNAVTNNSNDELKTFNFRGVNYKYIGEGTPQPIIQKEGSKYVLKYTVLVNDVTNGYDNLNLQFVIEGDSQKDLATVLSNLQGTNSVVAGQFTRLQGENRYETAVAVSAEKFDPNEASTIVITGGEALMDGLSAVPLASIKNAPILLSNPKTGLDKQTISEIKRVCKNLNRKTVYVVGGENSVPAKAVSQLEEMGAVVERLSGTDRYETSLEVARHLKKDSKDLYIVGGDGAADAMSISPVAATQFESGKVSPILVVPKNNIKKSTREFVKTNFGGSNAYIIGGENSVSSDAYRALNSEVASMERISGSDRFDTGVQLIKRFYTSYKAENLSKDVFDGRLKTVDASVGNDSYKIYPSAWNNYKGDKIAVNGAIFTSGDNKYLVDAQTAGPLAAAKEASVLLSGSKLTNDQVNLLKNNGVLSVVNTDVYQVGGVVSADVMSVVVDKLGL